MSVLTIAQRRVRVSFVFVLGGALVFGILLVGRAAEGPASAAPVASSVVAPAAARVKGRQIRVKVKGQRFGKKARVTLKGYRGKAKGVKRTVRVKRTKTVRRLKPGKYKIGARKITSDGAIARAVRIKPRRVRITKKRGANVVIRFHGPVIDPPPPPPPPPPAPSPSPTPAPTLGHKGAITRESTDRDGKQVTGSSGDPVVSLDGTKIAFTSSASDLVPGDTNRESDVFVKVLATGAVTRVSTDKDGNQANGRSLLPEFSPDGSRIVFVSLASNLVSVDTYRTNDVFIKVLATGAITNESTDSEGNQGNGNSDSPVFSPDGTKVAFWSRASNLVSDDTNNRDDVFLKSLATGTVTRVSTDKDGSQADGGGSGWRQQSGVFSPDGTRIVFTSFASDLVPGDTNAVSDVFIKDLTTGAVTRVSTDPNGGQASDSSRGAVFSPDGTRVLFRSSATNLDPAKSHWEYDLFVKVLATGAITRVSTDSEGKEARGASSDGVYSPDGTMIAFKSIASNLVPGDTNNDWDVFVKVLATGTVTRVSTDSQGNQANDDSAGPMFSQDGNKLVFYSAAPDLIPGDTNEADDVFVKVLSPKRK